jgi:hypothetical protein
MTRRNDSALDVTIDALASYRITRLLISDGIVDAPRQAVLDRLERAGRTKLIELIECPWCIGFWIAGSVVAARRWVPRQWSPVAKTLAYSSVAGILASQVRRLDDTHHVTEQLDEQLDQQLDAGDELASVGR